MAVGAGLRWLSLALAGARGRGAVDESRQGIVERAPDGRRQDRGQDGDGVGDRSWGGGQIGADGRQRWQGQGRHVAIGEWSEQLSPAMRRRLHCRRQPETGEYQSPSEATIRRTLQSMDAEALDHVVNEWTASRHRVEPGAGCAGRGVRTGTRCMSSRPSRTGRAWSWRNGRFRTRPTRFRSSSPCSGRWTWRGGWHRAGQRRATAPRVAQGSGSCDQAA